MVFSNHEGFLLSNDVAKRLYHEVASSCPVIDYHCHLDPQAVAENRQCTDLYTLWVATDPYKWRAMRINGIAEEMITGDADPDDKFAAWAQTLPRLAGNPLYHWSLLELKTFFGIDKVLTPDNATPLRQECNQYLSEKKRRSRQSTAKSQYRDLLHIGRMAG